MAERKRSDLRVIDGGGVSPDMEARPRHLKQEVHVIRETMASKQDLVGEVGSLHAEMHFLFFLNSTNKRSTCGIQGA
ncbi:hypothetical protein [Chromohalobacter canadensis]|uniref:hypothetical protein n=1 Tax=Chromohalobacter canadensis TaxID=141389 RepID=UPI00241054DD|nr:hypothetical protein [Chromohalobacter canadensis]